MCGYICEVSLECVDFSVHYVVFDSINKKKKEKTHQNMRSPDENTHKHMETWNISVITDAFLDQKRLNVCEHAVKMASHECFWKVPPGVARQEVGKGGGVGDYLRLIPGLCLEDRTNW